MTNLSQNDNYALCLRFWINILYVILYNNQINARALIGQCNQLWVIVQVNPRKFARLLNHYIKAIDHKFLWVIG